MTPSSCYALARPRPGSNDASNVTSTRTSNKTQSRRNDSAANKIIAAFDAGCARDDDCDGDIGQILDGCRKTEPTWTRSNVSSGDRTVSYFTFTDKKWVNETSRALNQKIDVCSRHYCAENIALSSKSQPVCVLLQSVNAAS